MPKWTLSPELVWVAKTWSWIWPVLATLIYAAVAMLLHRWISPRLKAWAARSKTAWDDIVVNAAGWPMLMIMMIGGAAILFYLLPVRVTTQGLALKIIRTACILVFVSFAHQFLTNWFRASKPGSWMRISILRKAIFSALYTIAALMILTLFEFPMGSVLATLGVSTLAVTLALQQILTNFFAGVQLSLDRPLEVGQSVQLENGMEGEVIVIGWMKTWVRAADGSRILIPNAKLTGLIIRNYTLGQRGPALQIKLPIDRTADLDKAEEIVTAAAKQASVEISQGGHHSEPIVQYTEMTVDSAVLTVTLYAADYKTAARTRSEFVKAAAMGLAAAGINLAKAS